MNINVKRQLKKATQVWGNIDKNRTDEPETSEIYRI